ncbi:ATP-binding cassette domain-containing protein [Hahella sp. SMD15-11]|uniref:ATP-binding cassette domain-containing protein n=1 Tax=Thermohahella caldifontis TaxID=3142973 RepID=A0AB39UTU3_9GAMM
MPAITLQNAVVRYGDHRALGPVTLTLEPDECVVLVGESGAGKSTLLGLLRAQVRKQAAWLPQELGLVPTLSVFHNVYMGRLHRFGTLSNVLNLVRPRPEAVAEIRPLLARLGLEPMIWKPAGELSGGQKQRVAVARALYQQADWILADEPVSALDREWANQVMQQLTQVHAGAVIALHNIDLALRYGQRIIGLKDGLIILDAPAQSLSRDDLMALYPDRSGSVPAHAG